MDQDSKIAFISWLTIFLCSVTLGIAFGNAAAIVVAPTIVLMVGGFGVAWYAYPVDPFGNLIAVSGIVGGIAWIFILLPILAIMFPAVAQLLS